MRLNFLCLQKKLSIRWRHLQISRSMTRAMRNCGRCEMQMIAPPAFRSAMIQLLSQGLVSEHRIKADAPDQRGHADRVEAVPGQQHEADEVARRIDQRKDLGRPAALRLAYRLTLRPPFEACPWRRTLTMVPAIIAGSMSGSSDNALKMRSKAPATPQSRNRRQTGFQLPNSSGRSRHCAPVRTILIPLEKHSAIPGGPPRVGLLAQTVRLDLRPLAIRDDAAVNRHPNLPFGRLEPEISHLEILILNRPRTVWR